MKLNYKRTILVGFAFFLISAFWQAYDATVPVILTNKFGMSQTWSGVIMALDNVLAVFLLPFFPDDVLCLLAGLTGYSWGFFAGMVLLTRPWGLLFRALVGSGELHLPLWGWVLLVLVAAALLVLSARYGSRIEDWLLRKIRRKRKPGAAPDGRAD